MRRLATDPERVDWFRVLADLQRAGVPVASVSQTTRIPHSTILGWRQGAEPKHVDGQRVLRLWAGVLDRAEDQAPKLEIVGNPFAR